MKMTKKDFDRIAGEVRALPAKQKEKRIKELLPELRASNPKFNEKKFREACFCCMNIIQAKRKIIRNLQRIINPHLWLCGYGKDFHIFVFTEVKCKHEGKSYRSDARFVGRLYNEHFGRIPGFYDNGIIDPWGGGCGCHPYASFCLEDLITIERWVIKNFQKEIEKSREFRKISN